MAERLKTLTDGIISALSDSELAGAIRTIDTLEPVGQGDDWGFTDEDQAVFDAATSVIAERASYYTLDSDEAALVVQMLREKDSESEQ